MIYLPNAPHVLSGSILNLLQTWFCGTGLEMLGSVEGTGHIWSPLQLRTHFRLPEQPGAGGGPASRSVTPPATRNTESWDEAKCPSGAPGSPASPAPAFPLGKPSAAAAQILPSSPRISLSVSHTHTWSLWLSSFLLAGDTLSRRLCITAIYLLLKYWVAFRLWHFELLGRKNVTLTTNFEVCFLNALTVYSLLLLLGHFKLL